MKGSIRTLPAGFSTGQIDGEDGVCYEYYATDFGQEEIASALEELETVEFEAVHGDVNRAMHCTRIKRAPPQPAAAGNATAADETPAVSAEELPALFIPPNPAPLLCKGKLPAEWEVISLSEWCIKTSSPNNADEARHLVSQRARELKANAVLDLEYGIAGAGGQGDKSHFFQGRLAIVGKRHAKGQPRDALAVDLNEEAVSALARSEARRQGALRFNYALYAFCAVLAIAVGALLGFASLPALIAAAVAVVLAIKLSKSTSIEDFLTHAPVATERQDTPPA